VDVTHIWWMLQISGDCYRYLVDFTDIWWILQISGECYRYLVLQISGGCYRYLVYVTDNLWMLQISGGFLVFLGCFMLSDKDLFVYTELLNRVPGSGPFIVLDKIPVVFIGVGLVIVILSFLGCYGTCVESVCCLFMVHIHTVLLYLIINIYKNCQIINKI